MTISDFVTTIPAVIALIGVIFTEVYKYRKYRYSKTSYAVLNRVYKPLHQLLQHYIYKNKNDIDPLDIHTECFSRISNIVQASYELVPPSLYNSYHNLIDLNERWTDDFIHFCKLIDIGYNQYRKLLHYPHKSVISEYSISCYDDKLLLQQVFFTRLQFYANIIVVIYIGFDNMLSGPIRNHLTNTRFIIFILVIMLFTISTCYKYIKMYKNNPFGVYPLF